jgi:hypothetical protein
MIRSFFFSLFFGTLVSLVAVHGGATGHSILQAVFVGILSSVGFMTATVLVRGRVRRKQGEAPELLAGEAATLYGPGQITDSGGSSEAWFYLSNRRLMLRDAGGAQVDLRLDEIQELRPPSAGFFSGTVSVVAKGRGVLTLKVPDAKRWHRAIHDAIHHKQG